MSTLPPKLSMSNVVCLSPQSRKSYALNFYLPPQPTKVIRSVSDPLGVDVADAHGAAPPPLKFNMTE